MTSRRTPPSAPAVWAGASAYLSLLLWSCPSRSCGRVNCNLGTTLATRPPPETVAAHVRRIYRLTSSSPRCPHLVRSWRGVRAARILVALPLAAARRCRHRAALGGLRQALDAGCPAEQCRPRHPFTTIGRRYPSSPCPSSSCLESALRAREARPRRDDLLPGALALARLLADHVAGVAFCPAWGAVPCARPVASASSVRPSRSRGPCRV